MKYRIREWCRARGRGSLAELAEAAGVRRATLSDIANGRRSPHRTTIEAIARALGITAETLKRKPKKRR